jgi:phosphoribosylamine--glycine ligase
MKVLVIGSGGREHAICWKMRQSPELSELFCAPGNPGIAELADLVPLSADEVHRLADFAQDLGVDLTVVGPELPLTLGIADEFRQRGLPVFGPSRKAAELEGSKVFAKQFMARHGIPTADFEVVHSAGEAERAAKKLGIPVVLKADGLAAGKGVMVCHSREEVAQALDVFFDERRFGAAGERVVVERCLEGEEVSFIVLSDGSRVLPLATSKDYKQLGEDDKGPNTGGMGAHSPSLVLDKGDAAEILSRIIMPTVEGLEDEGRSLVGFLYAGLMKTREGLKVLEYNVRLGDPEAQALLLRMEGDCLPILTSGAAGHFETSRLHFLKEASACIVLASREYPGRPIKGEVIEGLDAARGIPGVEIFHAATKVQEERVVTAGGRVLNICATGATLREALKTAYRAAGEIRWPAQILRRDIGKRVLSAAVSGREDGMGIR